jgi:hypothetical protein
MSVATLITGQGMLILFQPPVVSAGVGEHDVKKTPTASKVRMVNGEYVGVRSSAVFAVGAVSFVAFTVRFLSVKVGWSTLRLGQHFFAVAALNDGPVAVA